MICGATDIMYSVEDKFCSIHIPYTLINIIKKGRCGALVPKTLLRGL